MNIDYASVLKNDRVQPSSIAGGPISTESENDRSAVLFSSALRRLHQLAQVFPQDGGSSRSKLNHALQAAQVGRLIANQIAAGLEKENLATGIDCAALINFVEIGCLVRDIGSPPFGKAGEAAIQRWFTECGPDKIRSACHAHGTRILEASDAQLANALADFHEFDGHLQGLRVLAKLRWDKHSLGLNLTKTSIASFLQSLRMADGGWGLENERLAGKPGFFSTEAGLMKNVWSAFGYDPLPQRFPLSYIVGAANDITSCIGDLEEAIDLGLLHQHEAVDCIRNEWLSNYIPATPDPADEQILGMLTAAAKGQDSAGNDFNHKDLRRAFIQTLSDYAARHYLAQHDAVFAGTLDSLLQAESASGTILAVLKTYCRQRVFTLESLQRKDLIGYATMHGLLQHFGILLECSNMRFQLALGHSAEQEVSAESLYIERKLLALIPAQYRDTYTHLIDQLGNIHGRDEEFEEWNARAHLVVDFIAGMTESAAMATLRMLSGSNP